MDLSSLQCTPHFAGLEWHAEIDSTNTRALRLAFDPALPTPYLIGADRQTAGRGRGNNRWWSSEGALLVSLLLDPQADFAAPGFASLDPDRWPRLSLAAAVALCGALDRLLPGKAGLKWPNDVHVGNRKVAGILLEVPSNPGKRRLVLGLGVNVNNSLQSAPLELQSKACSLIDLLGGPQSREGLLEDWMGRFVQLGRALAIDDPALPEAWRRYCLLAGRDVALQTGDRELAGHCLGIDDAGALLIDTPHGTQRCFGGVLVRVQGS